MAASTKKKSTAAPKGKSASGSGKKSGTGGRSAGAASSRARTAREIPAAEPAAKETANPLIMREAVLWLIMAVCIFIFISYFGIGGYFGGVISDVSFGIFGITAYLFPFLLFMAAAFLISNRGVRVAGLKFVSSLGLYLCVCSFADLLMNPETTADVMSLYDGSAAGRSGGGVVGGLIGGFLRPALGDIGAGVVLLILAIVFLVLITQKSLMRGMQKQSSRMYHSARESSARRKEARARREEEWNLQQLELHEEKPEQVSWAQPEKPAAGKAGRRARSASGNAPAAAPKARTEIEVPVMFPVQAREPRANRRVTGVTMDTKIEGSPAHVGAEIHEITPRPGNGMERPEKEKTAGRKHRADAAPEREDAYIDLSEAEHGQKPQPEDSGLELYHADMPLHIEGIGGAQSGDVDLTAPPLRDDLSADLRAEDAETLSADAAETDEDAQDGMFRTSGEAWAGHAAMQAGTGVQTERNTRFDADTMAGAEMGIGARAERNTRFDADALTGAHTGTDVRTEKNVRSDADAPAETDAPAHGPAKKNPRSSQKEIEDGIASVEEEMAKTAEVVLPEYVYPPLDLLKRGRNSSSSNQESEIRKTAAKLQQTLNSFGVHVTVTNVSCGPSVTRYELLPEQGVKVSRIVGLADDIKLNLAAADIRIEAPIPGKAAVGIEVPNGENSAVALRDLIESEEFQKHPSKLAFATGKDIGGKVVVSDIAKMPHLLIAGATGSGKSVCINTLIMSILYKAKPEEVKLIMIDPKVVELSVYNGIPHLFIPVVTDPKKAAGALNWGVAEMMSRYDRFAEVGVRDLKGYNQKVEALKDVEDENKPQKLPQIVIIVDELADLMMVAPGEVEDSICRLAQLARAAGIHLIIATQRPSVNVITGLIKANMPSRIAFSVSSGVDSRTIIDMNGAEKLLGKGDMLFYPQGYQKPARVQGAFVSDEEVADVVDFLKNKNTAVAYDAVMEEQIAKVQQAVAAARSGEDSDALFADAGKFIIEKDKASIGMLQRVFKIGFNRAARIMDQLAEAGVVGPEEGTKPRKILMSAEQFENYLEQN